MIGRETALKSQIQILAIKSDFEYSLNHESNTLKFSKLNKMDNNDKLIQFLHLKSYNFSVIVDRFYQRKLEQQVHFCVTNVRSKNHSFKDRSI